MNYTYHIHQEVHPQKNQELGDILLDLERYSKITMILMLDWDFHKYNKRWYSYRLLEKHIVIEISKNGEINQVKFSKTQTSTDSSELSLIGRLLHPFLNWI